MTTTAARAQQLSRVPDTTAYFWITKALTTALGEASSDFLVRTLGPVPAVLLGFTAFAIAMIVQFSQRRYVAFAYWSAVAMVGIFGTMAADVLHVGFGVPYLASSILFAFSLAAVFVLWWRTQGTLSIHAIRTPQSEVFYWSAVVATFALGTAVGDWAATVLHLGYLGSAALFLVVILVPALYFARTRRHAVLCFWFAYVVTRPLGASIADWLGKPVSAGGVGIGSGPVSLVLAIAIAAIVTFLAIAKPDVVPKRT